MYDQTQTLVDNRQTYVDNRQTDNSQHLTDARNITMQEFLTPHKQAVSLYAIQNEYTIQNALSLMYDGGFWPKRTEGHGGNHHVDIVKKPKPEVPAITSSYKQRSEPTRLFTL